jgi:hypothetical protein
MDPGYLFQLYGRSMDDHCIADMFLSTLHKAYQLAQQGHSHQPTLQLQADLANMTHDINHNRNRTKMHT